MRKYPCRSATKWLRLDAYSGNLDAAANQARRDRLAAEKHCKDYNESCRMWAFTGECKRNAGFMNVQCQRSCHSCKLPDEVRMRIMHMLEGTMAEQPILLHVPACCSSSPRRLLVGVPHRNMPLSQKGRDSKTKVL